MGIDDLKRALQQAPAEPDVDLDDKLSYSDLELRRQRVLQLRLRRMTLAAIAAIVGVTEATVSRDLKWTRQHWAEKYGAPSGFDVTEKIGETIALYEDIENLALLEYTKLGEETRSRRLTPMFAARQRMACIRTAAQAREMQIRFLQDLGYMERQLGSVTVGLDTGQQIRARLKAQKLIDENALISEGERTWLSTGEATDPH